jgi:putative flippase GtrA
MIAILKRCLDRYLRSDESAWQFMRFATVGVKISTIDAGLVYLLTGTFDVNIYLARVVSLSSAILTGYLLNRYFTFDRGQRGCFYRQMAGHIGVHLTGGAINYGVFSLLVSVGDRCLQQHLALALLPLFSIWIGGLAGMTFNFILSRRLVFRRSDKPSAPLP